MDRELRAIIIAVLVCFGIPLLAYAAIDVAKDQPLGTTFQTNLNKQYQ